MNQETKAHNLGPSDYTYRISRDFKPNSNAREVEYRLYIIEFDVDYFFEKLDKITEEEIHSIIKGLMRTRKKQKIPLPVPLKYQKNFT